MINSCDIHMMILNWLVGLIRRVIGLIVSKMESQESNESYTQLELNK
jgi:hypothetical protein